MRGSLGGFPSSRKRWLKDRAFRLLYRTVAALVVLLVIWAADQLGGNPGRLARQSTQYLVNMQYDLVKLARQGIDALKAGHGLTVAVFAPTPSSTGGKQMGLPATGHLTRGFGWEVDSDGWPRFSTGIELQTAKACPVKAALPGKVKRLSENVGGKIVVIAHDQDLSTLYGRLGRVDVEVGQQVVQGQVIGTTTDTYVHFEIRVGDHLVDPLSRLQQPPG